MKFKPLAVLRCQPDADTDALNLGRVEQDLVQVSDAPDFLTQCAERLRIRLRNAAERSVLNQWTATYESADRLIAARNSMERKKSEYRQLAREHEVSEAEKTASLSKVQADIEENHFRREKAAYQRQNIERFVEGGSLQHGSEHQQRFHEANERRQLDARWELNESLRSLNTLIELQHWRREQRNRILQDRSLSAEEQSEALQFVDDLYAAKHASLKEDTRIFEER